MKGAVHQLVSSVRPGDAVGNTVLCTQKALKKLGYESEIYRETCAPDLKDSTFPIEDYLKHRSGDQLLIFHYSIGSDLNRFVFTLDQPVVLCYHNITPAHYFIDINNHVVGQLYHGRKQLACFADRVCMAVGDSEYNRQELDELGFPCTAVLPLAIDFKSLDIVPDPVVKTAYDDHRYNFLFVGRILPNKKIEDLIKLYTHYKKYVSHDSRLIIVGDWSGFEPYYQQLLRLVAEIDLPDVVMPGRVELDQLVAFYSVADVYVSMSEHEGFCAPLLEAMHFKVPVMARAAAAVPETMAGAGVLLCELSYPEAAEMMHLLAEPGLFRDRILEGQLERLLKYKAIRFEARLKNIINKALAYSGVGK